MPVTLVVPRLLALPADALAAEGALARLARYAGAARAAGADLDAAWLALAHDAHGTAAASIAPLAALALEGLGEAAGDDYVLEATPVTLVAGRDDVVNAGLVPDLDAAEAAALVGTLAAHFAEDGLRFAAPRPARWFARLARVPALETQPVGATLGRAIYRYLPGGPEGKTWQRWQNEIQMLLHEHPVNLAREDRNVAPVTGVWFWGGGRLDAWRGPNAVDVFATAGAAGTVARGIATRSGGPGAGRDDRSPDGSGSANPLPPRFDDLPEAGPGVHRVIVVDALGDERALAPFARDWLAPALAALERGRIDALQVVADGRGRAVAWQASPPGALARLAGRFRAAPFAPPADDDE